MTRASTKFSHQAKFERVIPSFTSIYHSLIIRWTYSIQRSFNKMETRRGSGGWQFADIAKTISLKIGMSKFWKNKTKNSILKIKIQKVRPVPNSWRNAFFAPRLNMFYLSKQKKKLHTDRKYHLVASL